MLKECTNKSITIGLKDVALLGELCIPKNALGLIIFSHGSGSSRLSPRNNYVAKILQKKGLATLLFDLLTEEEDAIYENRFNIELLTNRLIEVTKWVQEQKETDTLPIGYFGASTGAASALRAAVTLKGVVAVVVSRGGRPDLAMEFLEQVSTPTLLIVGGDDTIVIQLNKQAYQKLQCERSLEIIPNATHLFEEKGKLETVAISAAKWFAEKINAKPFDYV
ncbi:dienelactone hydrolase family protein [Kordia sp. YSTF-M3]|uniref:Dienelactone hydrolase family protein n=1 Tax=Kordia aestuariivivens TaxID=2759037 RepID=A0ABR7QH42_9FLAO|nr:alpha/beta family hydrolase [Kordia aestuariivivens]MBC8757639.1 dienelactone hydrolase family protein [Kordia aestuariivivens]